MNGQWIFPSALSSSWLEKISTIEKEQDRFKKVPDFSGEIEIQGRKKVKLEEFETVALDDLDDSLFKGRYETKYLFSPDLLGPVLEKLTSIYRVLVIGDSRVQEYESQYLDTREFRFYLDHQNGKLNRYKVRYRRYPGSHLVFFEIKFKNNKNQTRKWREKSSQENYCHEELTEKENQFVNSYFRDNPGLLIPRFMVNYSRLTLIHKKNPERVTLDLNLSYFKDGEAARYKNLVIAEVKQGRPSQDSEFFDVMRELGVLPRNFSKYCFGVYRFYPGLKYNRFKQRYNYIKSLSGKGRK